MVFTPSFFASLVTVIATTSNIQASTLRKLSGTGDGPTYTSPDQYAQLVLDAVNNQRATQNLPPLCLNTKLYQAAQRHTNDMATQKFIGHQGSDGSTPELRITDANYAWTAVAENVATGQVDVQAVMDSWDHSPEHLKNIMGEYTMFASAYAYNEESELKHHWTQDFGSSDTETCDGVAPAANTTPSTPQVQGHQETLTPAPQTSTPSTPGTILPTFLVPSPLTAPPSITTAPGASPPLTPAAQSLTPTVPLAMPPVTPAGTSPTPDCPTTF